MPSMRDIRQQTLDNLELAIGVAVCQRESWARCQALACVARYGPKHEVATNAERALELAQGGADPYQRVFPAAWPLRALIERDRREPARRILAEVLLQAKKITPMSSRSEALLLIFQAVAVGPACMWRRTFDELIEASTPVEHWRQARNIRDSVLIVAPLDMALARKTVEQLEDDKLKRKLLRKIDAGETRAPRSYF